MKKVSALVLSTILFSGMASACTKPSSPELPDAATAVTAQMVKAKNDVATYLKEANAYLDCAKSSNDHNRMVTNMKRVGKSFNEAVRAYKDRMASA